MPGETLLDRIATVLHRARIDGGWDDEAVARNVLLEMREPTLEMAHEGGECMDWDEQLADEKLAEFVTEQARFVWRAMIDAALNKARESAHTSSEIGHG